MNEFTARNLAIIKAWLPKTAKRLFDDTALAKLTETADAVIEFVNDAAQSHRYPVETGNLWESTAVAVYVDGVVRVFRTSANPHILQKWGDPERWYRGKEQLNLALSHTAAQCSTGVHIVLFASQPYANWLNAEHKTWAGFFDDLASGMSFEVHESFRTISEDMAIGNFKPKAHNNMMATFKTK